MFLGDVDAVFRITVGNLKQLVARFHGVGLVLSQDVGNSFRDATLSFLGCSGTSFFGSM